MNAHLARAAPQDWDLEFVTANPGLRRFVDEQLPLIARTGRPVVMIGESGTGKRHLARRMHRESWNRQEKLVEVDCRIHPYSVVESELFGRSGNERILIPGQRNRIRFGSALIHHVEALSPDNQARFLELLLTSDSNPLENRHPGAAPRIVTAFDTDPWRLVEQGLLHYKLYFQLNVHRVIIRPLRERTADIVPLVEHFLAMIGRLQLRLSVRAERKLSEYRFPGNVRELLAIVERAALLCRRHDHEIRSEHLRLEPVSAQPVSRSAERAAASSVTFDSSATVCRSRNITSADMSSVAFAPAPREPRPITVEGLTITLLEALRNEAGPVLAEHLPDSGALVNAPAIYLDRFLWYVENIFALVAYFEAGGHQRNGSKLLGLCESWMFRRCAEMDLKVRAPRHSFTAFGSVQEVVRRIDEVLRQVLPPDLIAWNEELDGQLPKTGLLGSIRRQLHRLYIALALLQAKGKQTQAAALLNVGECLLLHHRRKYGIALVRP